MIADLYRANGPAQFWRPLLRPSPTAEQWETAVQGAADVLPLGVRPPGATIDSILVQVLGEGQFGSDHWRLSAAKRMYYRVKPALPRALTRTLRRVYQRSAPKAFRLEWPIESRFAQFQWETVRRLLERSGQATLPFIDFWPAGHRAALVLTHDVETAEGQAHVRAVADLETRYGFHSSFNFVPERYSLDGALQRELRDRGFEVGVHGLTHDGKLFRSHGEFVRRARHINRYLHEWGAVGFRAPLTHREPEWMQVLEIEYDLSFFDSDPYEPIPGGTMSLWPFMLGHFVELPYTLVQDYTLTEVLGETTPRLWLDKLDFLDRYRGMALLNTHPDYLLNAVTWRVYGDFLQAVSERGGYWHALPREVARWWRARAQADSIETLPGAVVGTIDLRPAS